ncbi:MAG: DoxX family membrane protein [Acidobacteriia bacterium]|nr:DoxX family membrane protein [Terriglobia bacterium]
MMQSFPLTLRRAFIWLGRLVLGGIFLYAGYAKIVLPTMHPRPPLGVALTFFAMQVDSYQLLPPWGVTFVAHTLPFAEVALGLLLLAGWGLRIWSTLVSLIMAGFFAAVVRSYALGLEINCGCFATPEKLTGITVLRDGLLLALVLLMTVFAFQEARAPHPWTAPQKPEPQTPKSQ